MSRGLVLTLVAALTVVVAAGVAFVVWSWPHDDVPADPDVVVVLGGAGADRLALGRQVADTYGSVLVLSSSAAHFGDLAGLTCGEDAICIDPVPETTHGEARAIARLAAEQGWDHVTVATSRLHTTRARLLFRQCLGDRVTVVGSVRDGGRWLSSRALAREVFGIPAAVTIRRAC